MQTVLWEIGKEIVEFEQKGKTRAEYGKELLKSLSADMSARFGRGFSRSILQNMRLLYLAYPKCQTLSGKSQKSETQLAESTGIEKCQTLSDKFEPIGKPKPYFINPIIEPAVASYFSFASCGTSAEKVSPQRFHRSFSCS
ncbi:MAG: hypothetical protein A2161_06040 [Candidatus Schekmanbacteria bacterium RBG_13_48_7]|uniref:YhcG N-terminal domain-containing protein n=1 Tax=Candidatus Schekmanbacteria bacterium RBG_13_48_7 TaxID=1817878 RepID=A0A1F7RPP0_9BACT|nr:MAG: hypothetical protein A2161_06040 [Candidatus Schekmanbacteria bacterium RBG_13_48_7]